MAKSYKKPIYNNIQFASDVEVEYYKLLQNKVLNNEIKFFEYSVDKFIVIPSFVDFKGRKFKETTYTIDFKITLNNDEIIYVDTKGGTARQHDPKEIVKLNLIRHQNPNIKVYWISKTPVYMGSKWVETTPYYDFLNKLRTRYKKNFPDTYMLRGKKKPKYLEWNNDFNFKNIDGLFYVWEKTKIIKKSKKK